MDNAEPKSGEPEQSRSDEMGEIVYPDGRIEHPHALYEPKDIRFRGLLLVVVIVCCYAAIHYYMIWRYLHFQEHTQDLVKQSPYPLAPTLSNALPPEPRLEQLDRIGAAQSSPLGLAGAGQEVRAVDREIGDQEKTLHSYGPTADKDFVHIPIERAIKAVAGDLPVAKHSSPDGAAKSDGLLEEGASNSGRMFRGPSP